MQPSLKTYTEILDTNGKYFVDTEGNIFSHIGSIKKLKLGTLNGYSSVWIYFPDNKRLNKKVHRLVYEAFNGPLPLGFDIDHINRDKRDNRLSNLRVVTRLQNCMNSKPKRNRKYKGIYSCTEGRKSNWRALIRVEGKNLFLGRYATELQAAIAYDLEAIKTFGVHAYTNFLKIADSLEREC